MKPVARRVLGIDASTQSIAFCLYHNRKPVSWGKIRLSGNDVFERVGDANKKTYALLKANKVDYVAIESAVFVNNTQVVKKLSYVYGSIMGAVAASGVKLIDVPPMTWQTAIGNPALTKSEKDAIVRRYPRKKKSFYDAKRREIRKQRTMDFFKKHYGIELTDDDVADACGIAYYAYHNLTKR